MGNSTTVIVPNTIPSMQVAAPLARRTSLYLSRLSLVEVGLDVVTIFCAIEVASAMYSVMGLQPKIPWSPFHVHYAAAAASIVISILLAQIGAYRVSGSLLGVRESACVIQAVFYVAGITLLASVLTAGSNEVLPLLATVGFIGVLLICQKRIYCYVSVLLRSRRAKMDRVVIYGRAESTLSLLDALLRSPRRNFIPAACFIETSESDVARIVKRKSASIEMHHADNFGEKLLNRANAKFVIIASPLSSSEKLESIIAESRRAGATILFGAEAHTRCSVGIEYFELDGQLLYGVQTASANEIYDILKRFFDVAISALLLLIGAVPMLLATVAIAIDTRGPILFKQTRIGRHGKPFTILKFRTMHTEDCGYRVSPSDSHDPRITRVGRILRKTSVDELPQLLNIFRGEMTLVGPRPEMPFIVAGYNETQMQRLAVKPGLTGLWQISEDRRYPIHENIHYDLYYLKHRSMFIDLALIFHTALAAVRGI